MDAGEYLFKTKQVVIRTLEEGGMFDYAERVRRCRYRGRRCGLRFCPLCRWSWGKNIFDDLLPQVWADVEQGARLISATFIVADVPMFSLRATAQQIREDIRRVASQITGLAGIVWNLESTPSENEADYEHPHAHAVLSLNPALNRGRDYISEFRLHQMWTEHQAGGSVDVLKLAPASRSGRTIQNIAERHVRYMSYALKASPAQTKEQMEAELEQGFIERIRQLFGLHLSGVMGRLEYETQSHTVRPHPVVEAA